MIRDQFDVLYEDGAKSGRVMSICLHPFLIGHPHRSKYFDQALTHIRSGRKSGSPRAARSSTGTRKRPASDQPPLQCRADDGLDGPALPVLPPAAVASRADLHRNDHDRRDPARRSRAALGFDPAEHPVALQLGGSDPGGSRSARRSRRISVTTKSISTSAARRTACRRVASVPA